jgi:hypothetical protein
MFQLFDVLSTVYLILALAAVVTLFWLAVTAIRALNVYLATNRPPRSD